MTNRNEVHPRAMPNHEALFQQAAAALSRGATADAAAALDRLLAGTPDHGEARHMRGVIALQKGEADQAVTHLRHAARLQSGAAVLANLGIALAAAGHEQEAEAVLREAASAEHPQAAYNLGHLLATRGAKDEAEHWLRAALALEPGYTRASCELAALLMESARAVLARDVLEAAQRHAPGHPMVLLHMGLADRLLGRHADACVALGQAREALGPLPELMLGLGSCLQECDRMEEALEVYRALLAAAPDRYGDVLRALSSASHGCFDLRPSKLRQLLGAA